MAPLRHHSDQAIMIIDQDIHHRIHEQGQVVLRFQRLLCKASIGEFVRLGSGSLHGRTTATVENAELDHAVVDQMSHLPAKGVHLAHQIAFAQPPDCRIAGESADGVKVLGDQER